MPVFDYKCDNCKNEERDVYINNVNDFSSILCKKCGKEMRKLFPKNVHAKIGVEFDSRDRGKVIKEKNEMLKKKHAGYSYEQKSLREKIQGSITEKLRK